MSQKKKDMDANIGRDMHTDQGLIKLIEDVLAKGKGIQQLNKIGRAHV